MEKERRYKRFSVEMMQLSGSMMPAKQVTILDINLDEVTIKADMRLNMGSDYSLKLKENNEVISLRGTVIWSSLSEAKKGPNGEVIPIYTGGLKLKGVSNDILSDLARFIDARREEDEGGPGDIRLHIDEEEEVSSEFAAGYKAKQISLGGMLIETTSEVEIEKRLSMEISLPGGALMRFQGRVASCLSISGTDPQRYDVGIEFLDMSEEDRGKLRGFIRSLE